MTIYEFIKMLPSNDNNLHLPTAHVLLFLLFPLFPLILVANHRTALAYRATPQSYTVTLYAQKSIRKHADNAITAKREQCDKLAGKRKMKQH
jgi:hypothetical protein